MNLFSLSQVEPTAKNVLENKNNLYTVRGNHAKKKRKLFFFFAQYTDLVKNLVFFYKVMITLLDDLTTAIILIKCASKNDYIRDCSS